MRPEEQDRLELIRQQDDRRAHLRKFALTLLEQCKDENLTLNEFDWVMDVIQKRILKDTTLRDGLTL